MAVRGVFPNSSPFDIHYGDWTLFNVDALEFPHLSEEAFYAGLDATGMNLQAATIALAGPMMNVFLATVSLVIICGRWLEKKIYAATFSFWFLAFKIGGSGVMSRSGPSGRPLISGFFQPQPASPRG